MQQQILNHLNDLRIAEKMPHSEIKDLQIEEFFAWISGLDIGYLLIDDQSVDYIRYRYVSYDHPEYSFAVTVIQTDKNDMIMIDADFE